jgi:hypothetical protein
MSRRVLKMALAIAAVLALGVGTNAQVGVMSAARSRDVQAIVRHIELEKTAAVDELLGSWQSNLNADLYDAWGELREVAMKAPAWQVYGASLVGDFTTMGKILRGQASAGKYINALSEPQAKQAKGFGEKPGANVFGGAVDNLVFTPIAPCRMVDTRGTGARTGLLLVNTNRTFDLEDEGFGQGQGGDVSCVGIPTVSPTAWAVNITVVGPYAGLGALKGWAAASAEPSASIINYGPNVSGGIANGLTMTGCNNCVDDITVRAIGTATHVIIDVVGYYDAPVVSNAAVTRLAGTPVTGIGTTETNVASPTCPAGTTLISGEIDDTGVNGILADFFTSGGTWIAAMRTTSGTMSATAYARCQDTPIQQ